jgi:DNA-binding FrmR family transcriptional regulator
MKAKELSVDDLVTRLKRVEGQIKGIQKMLEEGRDCKQIIQQITAAKKALDRVGLNLIYTIMEMCLAREAQDHPNPGYSREELKRAFLGLG